jgi:hypothetical protein
MRKAETARRRDGETARRVDAGVARGKTCRARHSFASPFVAWSAGGGGCIIAAVRSGRLKACPLAIFADGSLGTHLPWGLGKGPR